MRIEVIESSAINDGNIRFDSSYHLSDGPITKRLFLNCPYQIVTLDNVCERIFKGNIFKRTYVENSQFGYPFLTGSDIMKSDLDNVRFISKKYTKSSNKYFVDEDWILVTRSGTLGNLVFSNALFKDKIITDDLIRIVPKNDLILDGFIYAFLSSKYGNGLLTQGSYGGVIKHIEPHHIKNIPIPVFPQKIHNEINTLIHSSKQQRVRAFRKLNEATSFFDNKYENKTESSKTFIKSVTDLKFSWVSRNNESKVQKVENSLKSEKCYKIKDIANTVFSPPMFKHIYLEKDNGYPFLKGGDLRKNLRKRKNFLSTKGVGDVNDYQVKENCVLVYKSGPRNGMLGKTFIVDDSINGFCLSDHVIRIDIDDEKLNLWVFAYLKSKIGLSMLQNLATGSAIPFITPKRLSDLLIPNSSKAELDRNYRLIKDFIDCFSDAHFKELKAISLVEKEIESWQ